MALPERIVLHGHLQVGVSRRREELARTSADIPDRRTGGTTPGAIPPSERASSFRGIPRRTESRQAVLEGFGGVGEPCPPLCGEVGDRPRHAARLPDRPSR